ncbi:MAG: hypothetical protein HND48_09305 [Chloroflexi bacterium]|nr:hypothetical protein [Chloroflexota bacterium]
MRKPRIEAFDTSKQRREPDNINTEGLVPLVPKPPFPAPQTVYSTTPKEEIRETVAGMPEIGQAGNRAKGQARMTDSPIDGKPESLIDRNLAECVRAALAAKAAKKESFRFPEELMAILEDLPYEMKKTYGKRITKTAVFVAAFAAYLWEFKHKGQDSLLYKHLIEADNA